GSTPLTSVWTLRPVTSNSSRWTSLARASPKRIVERPRNGLGLGVARKSTAFTSSTPTMGAEPAAGTVYATGAPQLPPPSRPRSQNVTLPVTTSSVVSAADACTVALPKVPDIGVPLPAGAGNLPLEYSA